MAYIIGFFRLTGGGRRPTWVSDAFREAGQAIWMEIWMEIFAGRPQSIIEWSWLIINHCSSVFMSHEKYGIEYTNRNTKTCHFWESKWLRNALLAMQIVAAGNIWKAFLVDLSAGVRRIYYWIKQNAFLVNIGLMCQLVIIETCSERKPKNTEIWPCEI